MPNKQFHLNERVVGRINANKDQIGYVREVIREGSKSKYGVSWENGRLTIVTTRAISSASAEIAQLQVNNNIGAEIGPRDHQSSDNDDISSESLSEHDGRDRLSDVRTSLDHRYSLF